jgi:hypothetical protein
LLSLFATGSSVSAETEHSFYLSLLVLAIRPRICLSSVPSRNEKSRRSEAKGDLPVEWRDSALIIFEGMAVKRKRKGVPMEIDEQILWHGITMHRGGIDL